MASSIILTCPECDKQLKASSELLGKKIRCKACGAIFVGKATKAPAARAPVGKGKEAAKPAAQAKAPPAPVVEEDDKPYGVTEEYLGRRCPNCTTKLDEDQVVCLECGYNTMTRQRAERRKVADTTTGDIILWLLPGILCVLVIIGLITANLLYIFNVSQETFGEVWYDFLGGKFLKIYTSIFCAFLVYKGGRFAVNRLIFDNKPPEVEDKSVSSDEEDE